MLSSLFEKDYKAMTAAGVKFTPADIVRLNALALKAKLSRKAFGAMHHPRCVFLGKLILREPTLAHEMWVEQVGEYIDLAAHRNFLFVQAFALSRTAASLPDPANARRVVRKVFGFAEQLAAKVTNEQLSDAIDYCLFGADWTIGEFAPGTKHQSPGTPSPALGVIAGALARRIPLTLEDAKKLTASQILEISARATYRDGDFDSDEAHHHAMGEYVRARDEIAERANKGATT